MKIIEESFKGLYPESLFEYNSKLKYSGKFKGFNSNVRLKGNNLVISLSKNWRAVSRDIKIGLIQSLMVKLFKKPVETQNIDLYNIFLKNVHISVAKTKSNPIMDQSFDRVNEKYFFGLIEKPNLVIGKSSFSRLGTYDYGTDTITISKVIIEQREEILDYIMYHEILHKKHKFYNKGGKTFHHTAEFRKKEKEFENSAIIEKELSYLPRRISILKKVSDLLF